MIIVMGYMQLREGDADILRRLIASHIEAVRACDGCLQYSFAVDIEKPDLIWVSERWRDKAAQAQHMASDHMVKFNMTMRRVKIVTGRISSFEPDGTVNRLIDV